MLNNSIVDISDLDGLTALTTLWLDKNSIVDVSDLEDLTNLISLLLRGNPIADYGPLRRLKDTIGAAGKTLYIDINTTNNPPVFTDGDSTIRRVLENTGPNIEIGTEVAHIGIISEKKTLGFTGFLVYMRVC